MKALLFTLAAVASLLCLTPGILRGAPETEKPEIDPDSQVATFLERIEELEGRIINLEKRQPLIATPYQPLELPQPIRPVPPAIAHNLENADTPPVREPSSPPLVKATVQDTIAGMAEVTLSGPNATDVQSS